MELLPAGQNYQPQLGTFGTGAITVHYLLTGYAVAPRQPMAMLCEQHENRPILHAIISKSVNYKERSNKTNLPSTTREDTVCTVSFNPRALIRFKTTQIALTTAPQANQFLPLTVKSESSLNQLEEK